MKLLSVESLGTSPPSESTPRFPASHREKKLRRSKLERLERVESSWLDGSRTNDKPSLETLQYRGYRMLGARPKLILGSWDYAFGELGGFVRFPRPRLRKFRRALLLTTDAEKNAPQRDLQAGRVKGAGQVWEVSGAVRVYRAVTVVAARHPSTDTSWHSSRKDRAWRS